MTPSSSSLLEDQLKKNKEELNSAVSAWYNKLIIDRYKSISMTRESQTVTENIAIQQNTAECRFFC